ncbi:MAG TPA: peptidylprolyl isomerase [Vicinamibacteria bacterium]|nr:peptidylprolyl isomerase [Vicinamibacteria bacterium]
MKTSLGTIRIELYPEEAPKTVENFLAYTREGFYDGTIFHRVIEGFMIQGGGFNADMTEKGTRSPIENEADNGLKNERGTIAMARTMEPHSASSQFFINSKDNPPLDFSGKSVRGWGYAVFGRVVEGLQVVDAIEGVATTNRSGHQDVPVDPVIIESVRLLN